MDTGSHSSVEIRQQNRREILRLLSRNGAMLRHQLCDATGLTGAGLSRILRELMDTGLITEDAPEARKGNVGRRSACVRVDPEGAYVLGVTITANRKSVVLMDAGRAAHGQVDLDEIAISDPVATLKALSDAALELIQEAQMSVETATMLSERVPQDIVLHIDANPDERHRSSRYARSLAGMGLGCGFEVRLKPDAWCASSVADHVVKEKHLRVA